MHHGVTQFGCSNVSSDRLVPLRSSSSARRLHLGERRRHRRGHIAALHYTIWVYQCIFLPSCPPQVQLIRESSAPGGAEETQERAAGALWGLSVSEASSVAIGQAGGIEPLLQLTQSPREVGG